MTESEIRDCLNKVESGDLCRVVVKEFNKLERLKDKTTGDLISNIAPVSTLKT